MCSQSGLCFRWYQGSCGPRWVPCRPHETCYLGYFITAVQHSISCQWPSAINSSMLAMELLQACPKPLMAYWPVPVMRISMISWADLMADWYLSIPVHNKCIKSTKSSNIQDTCITYHIATELKPTTWWTHKELGGGGFKNTCELLNPRALKISMLYKICMDKIFCVEFQRSPLKFHTKYLTHALKDVHFIHRWKFKSS